MNLEWLEELAKKEPDKDLAKLDELEKKYKEVFGYNDDFTTVLCVDYEYLFEQLENCIRLKIPYHILYKDRDLNHTDVIL